MDAKTQRLAALIKQSGNTVFFGGAGVSTESGIPDFRSATGLYAAQKSYGLPPEELLSHHVFVQEPALFFRYYKENLISVNAKPNPAHISLARLEERGLLSAVITQNIDGLHQSAGSRNVIELHGSNHRQYCMSCGERYSLEYVLSTPHCRDEFVPLCESCGGIVRPDVVLYEENLDCEVIEAAISALKAADLLIVGGTSLNVYPAAGMLRYFKGENLILINKSATPYDRQAQLVIHDSVGRILGEAAERVLNN